MWFSKTYPASSIIIIGDSNLVINELNIALPDIVIANISQFFSIYNFSKSFFSLYVYNIVRYSYLDETNSYIFYLFIFNLNYKLSSYLTSYSNSHISFCFIYSKTS